MNKVILMGRLTRDPEVRYGGANNSAVARFSLAVDRRFKRDGDEQTADFINCVIWNKQAENLAKYVKQGSLIGVEGRIQTRNYESNGTTRYVTEVLCDNVQFLETKNSSKGQQAEEETKEEDSFAGKINNVGDDDLPW